MQSGSFDLENCLRVISNILIPTDFSPASWHATQLGLELSHLNGGAKLSFLHIYPVTSKYISVGNGKTNVKAMDDVKLRMNQLSQSLKVNGDSDTEIENVVLSGQVDEIIMNFIGDHHFDLIIVGINSNGQSNDIGSHTVKLIKDSGIPVMIVPNKSDNGAFTD